MWTEERIGLLRKLWGQGLSASQIAGRIGGVTRNAVIGKVHRLGLARRVTTTHAPRQPNGVALPFRPTRVQIPTGAAAKNKANARPPKVRRADSVAAKTILASIKAAFPCDILEVGSHQCRWPYGDPKEEGFHLCGRQKCKGTSYCGPHADVAFQSTARAW